MESIKKTINTAGEFQSNAHIKTFLTKKKKKKGPRGLFDGISGTWLRQMSYSMCRFWAYDESKKIVGATGKDAPAWKLAVAGSMGKKSTSICRTRFLKLIFLPNIAGGIAGFIGNPGGAYRL